MTNAADPVETGLVASLARPGGNITGLVTYSPELSGKRLELLKEAFPKVSRVAVLTNPANPEQEARVKETKVAAQGLRVQLQILQVRESSTFDKAFLAINKEHAQALLPLVTRSSFPTECQIVDFAARTGCRLCTTGWSLWTPVALWPMGRVIMLCFCEPQLT